MQQINLNIKTRHDLSFTAVDTDNRLDANWIPPRIQEQRDGWNRGVELGNAMIEEIRALHRADENSAYNAIRFAFNDINWRIGGWGPEFGFSEGIAALAVVGMRALREGADMFEEESIAAEIQRLEAEEAAQ